MAGQQLAPRNKQKKQGNIETESFIKRLLAIKWMAVFSTLIAVAAVVTMLCDAYRESLILAVVSIGFAVLSLEE